MRRTIVFAAMAVVATVWAAKADEGWLMQIRDQDDPPGTWYMWDWFQTKELCETHAQLEREISGLEFRCMEVK